MLNETWGDQYRRLCRAYERLQTAGAEVSDRDVDPRDVLPAFCNEALAPMYWVQNLVVGRSQPDSHGSATVEIPPLHGQTTANTSCLTPVVADLHRWQRARYRVEAMTRSACSGRAGCWRARRAYGPRTLRCRRCPIPAFINGYWAPVIVGQEYRHDGARRSALSVTACLVSCRVLGRGFLVH